MFAKRQSFDQCSLWARACLCRLFVLVTDHPLRSTTGDLFQREMDDNMDEAQLLREANDVADLRTAAGLPETLQLGEDSYKVLGVRPRDLSFKQRDSISHLLRSNMEDMYKQAGWGWKEEEKSREIYHSMARLLLITSNDTDDVKAFTAFRFEWDDDEEPEFPVLYLYELQVHPCMRYKGAGKALVRALQTTATTTHMRKIMLTCFKANTGALAFYRKSGTPINLYTYTPIKTHSIYTKIPIKPIILYHIYVLNPQDSASTQTPPLTMGTQRRCMRFYQTSLSERYPNPNHWIV
jgi:ribosomal protein S18 acetylase RimI-like enzyme